MIKVTQPDDTLTQAMKYEDIKTPQVFRGCPNRTVHEGTLGIFIKLPAASGGDKVTGSILFRLDVNNPFNQYCGVTADFTEYEPLDLELVVTKEGK